MSYLTPQRRVVSRPFRPTRLVTQLILAPDMRLMPTRGLSGLGDINDVFARLQKDLKDQAIKQAAIQTGIGVALNFIPVVGWAASAIVTLAGAIQGDKYQRETQEVIADTQMQVQAMVATYDARLQVEQARVFESVKPAAIELAISGAPLNGLDGLDGIGSKIKKGFKKAGNVITDAAKSIADGADKLTNKDTYKIAVMAIAPVTMISTKVATQIAQHASKEIKPIAAKVLPGSVVKVLDQVTKPIDKAVNVADKVAGNLIEPAQDAVDTATGKRGLDKAKEARSRVLAEARATLESQYAETVSRMNSAEFRAGLTRQIAGLLRQDPSIQAMINQRLALQQQGRPGGAQPAGAGQKPAEGGVNPALVAGAALVVKLLL